jgi:hypothetical protein
MTKQKRDGGKEENGKRAAVQELPDWISDRNWDNKIMVVRENRRERKKRSERTENK